MHTTPNTDTCGVLMRVWHSKCARTPIDPTEALTLRYATADNVLRQTRCYTHHENTCTKYTSIKIPCILESMVDRIATILDPWSHTLEMFAAIYAIDAQCLTSK